MQDHYTPYEAAEIFGANFRTIYVWMRSGKLHAVKIGGRWYIPKKATADLMENGNTRAWQKEGG